MKTGTQAAHIGYSPDPIPHAKAALAIRPHHRHPGIGNPVVTPLTRHNWRISTSGLESDQQRARKAGGGPV